MQPPNGNSSLPQGSSPKIGPIDPTILNQLKEIKGVKDIFPAANLVAALLRQISINITRAPRHLHTAAQVLGRSNKVYEAIIDSLEQVNAYTSEELANCWDSFERCTTAIPILERYVPLRSVSDFIQSNPMLPIASYWTYPTLLILQTKNSPSFLQIPARRKLLATCMLGRKKGINWQMRCQPSKTKRSRFLNYPFCIMAC